MNNELDLPEDYLRVILEQEVPKYGISVVDKDTNQIIHYVAYWNEPTDDDYLLLEEEMKLDFGSDYDYFLRAAFLGEVEYFHKVLKLIQEHTNEQKAKSSSSKA